MLPSAVAPTVISCRLGVLTAPAEVVAAEASPLAWTYLEADLVRYNLSNFSQFWRTQKSIVQRNATFTALQRTVTVTFDAGHAF